MKNEPIDNEKLQEIIVQQAHEIDSQQQEINYLKEKLDYLIRQKYSSKSEKFPSNQPSLFDEDNQEEIVVVEEDKEVIEYSRRKGGRKKAPPSLPRVRVEHDINEEDKICSCGDTMHLVKELVSEQYDIVPARFQIVQNVRFVYGCRCGAKPKTTPVPPMILPKSQITPSFLATLAVQKFEDALPLHRQAKIFKNRFGVPFSDTSLSNWIIKGSMALKPIMELLQQKLLENEYIQADETSLQVLKEDNRKATQKSYLWLSVGMDKYPVVYMHYANSRSADTPTTLFKGFRGYLQSDGYAGYNAITKQEGITQLGCFAHARRKFADIIKSNKSDLESKAYAKEAVTLIQKLYKIEKAIKAEPPNIKYKARDEQAKPIIDKLRAWIDTKFFKAQQIGGAIAKAFIYLNNQFRKLTVYLEDGRLHIDNNRAENHIRPIALGRKNWLFATSTKGAEAIAIWYTIIESAKANKLEPYFYLEYLLTKLPIYINEKRDIEELLPWNVSKELLA